MPNHLTLEQISLFKQLPGYWGCKDLNSVFVYANQAYGELIGLKRAEDCIGRTDFEMPSPTAACAAEFQQQDRYVIETGHSVKVLDIHPYLMATGMRIYLPRHRGVIAKARSKAPFSSGKI